jgi:ATP-dependent DNA helicase RecQ
LKAKNVQEEAYAKSLVLLKKYWGYDALRPGQVDAVKAILADNHSLIVLPTGGGKSICFQLPALVKSGLCLVISPLLALMRDQVQQLSKRGIAAVSINSDDSQNKIEQKLLNARNGLYKFLYLSPERLSTDLFQRYLADLPLSFLAIDEAHCISEWGHEFRPSYRDIALHLPTEIQKVAVTATATTKVQADILEVLEIGNATKVMGDFVRPNLHLWTTSTERAFNSVIKTVTRAEGAGLIFCNTRRQTQKFADKLQSIDESAEAYHAGLDSEKRKTIQNDWINGEIRTVACTNAFGMGIDKPDCRFVLHAHLPSSLEAYYQEAGRAGRDLATAYPILFYNKAAYKKQVEQLTQQYPSYDDLDHVYQVLCDEIDLGLNDAMEEWEWLDIDMDKLAKRAKVKRSLVYYAFQRLDEQGILNLEEVSKSFYKLNFAVNTIDLPRELSTQKRQFIDRLQRLIPTLKLKNGYLNERQLSEGMQLSTNVLKRSFEVLQNEKYLSFELINSTFRIHLVEPRQRKIPVDKTALFVGRDRKKDKLSWMFRYATTEKCRSVFIAAYFGQQIKEDCGVCDNCQKKRKIQEKSEIELAVKNWYSKVPNKQNPIFEGVFLEGFPRDSRNQIQREIHQYTAEGLLYKNADGKLFRK